MKISQLSVFFVCLSFIGLASAQGNGPSLGEVARQSQATGKSKIVITDENISRGAAQGEHAAQVSADASAEKQTTDAAAQTSTDENQNSSPEVAESPDHVSARKRVENLQAVIDREQKAVKETEEKLAAADNDSERSRMQLALDSHHEHLNTLSDDLRDAQIELKNTPFSTKPVPPTNEMQ